MNADDRMRSFQMTESKSLNSPIGYWLKKVDQLITERINQIQAKNGVSRLEWQTLNPLFEKESTSEQGLHHTLAPFADMPTLRNILARFAELAWLDVSNDDEGTIIYHLNSEGKQQHQKVLQAQQEARALAMNGISSTDYATVIRTLQQMAANLESPETVADPEP
jgi:DNA-binding MarR family transcriptional regulator